MRRPGQNDVRSAFTLIESMATVSVLAILGSITSFLVLDAVDGYTDASNSAQLHAELSIALDRAARELRMIELKRQINELSEQLGKEAPYDVSFAGEDREGGIQ